MASKMPKSILKKPALADTSSIPLEHDLSLFYDSPTPNTSDAVQTYDHSRREEADAGDVRTKEDRNREIALYHANLIQRRKDLELQILLSMETLIDYPLAGAPNDASNPSAVDVREVKQHLRPFQPSDYDDLIQERNINEHCGYVLCPNNRLKDGGGGLYRLLGKNGRAKDFKVVAKAELEKWCSESCARRALYVRVQLSERPAWEREGLGVEVDLLDEPTLGDDLVPAMDRMDLSGGDDESKPGASDLALERGDRGFGAKNGLVDVMIHENTSGGSNKPPFLEPQELSERLDSMHLNLEGHIPTFEHRQRAYDDEAEEVEQDSDGIF